MSAGNGDTILWGTRIREDLPEGGATEARVLDTGQAKTADRWVMLAVAGCLQ